MRRTSSPPRGYSTVWNCARLRRWRRKSRGNRARGGVQRGGSVGRGGAASELTVTETPGGPVEPVDDFGAFEGEAVGETVAVPAAAAAEEEEEFADFAVAEAPASG